MKLTFNLFIHWNISPEIIQIGGFPLRYYSILFALAFYCSYKILFHIYKKESKPIFFLNKLTLYIFLGTLIGARLGQAFFYEFGYYKYHLTEIFLPFKIQNGNFKWTGYEGLASHGGAIGILIALYLYCKKYNQPFLWIVDRLAIVIALSAFFIRIGNLFNSEIIGRPSTLPWAFIFEKIDFIPRHPTQIYEAICYLIIFTILYIRYKVRLIPRPGYLFGIFLVLVFSVRFILEFLKENQSSFENTMSLNMGQILSLPFIIVGIILLINSFNRKPIKKKL